jgi:hypothetical protein
MDFRRNKFLRNFENCWHTTYYIPNCVFELRCQPVEYTLTKLTNVCIVCTYMYVQGYHTSVEQSRFDRVNANKEILVEAHTHIRRNEKKNMHHNIRIAYSISKGRWRGGKRVYI